MFMNMYVHGYVYVYDSICWALKCPVHCAEQFLELKICISPQFRAIDPPNPARGFIQQNENVRFATAACMQKYGNVSFATVACAKCMRYGGRGGTHTMGGGGGWQHGTRNHIYIYICMFQLLPFVTFWSPKWRSPTLALKRSQKKTKRSLGRAWVFECFWDMFKGGRSQRLYTHILVHRERGWYTCFHYFDLPMFFNSKSWPTLSAPRGFQRKVHHPWCRKL